MYKLNIFNIFSQLFLLFYLFFVVELKIEFIALIFVFGLLIAIFRNKITISEKVNKIINFVSFALLWICPFEGVLALIYLLIIYGLYQVTDNNYSVSSKKIGYIIILLVVVFCYGTNGLIYSINNNKEIIELFDNLAYKLSLLAGSLLLIGLSFKSTEKNIEAKPDLYFSIGSNILLGLFVLYQLYIFKDFSNYFLLLFFLGVILSFYIKIDRNKKVILLLVFSILVLSLMVLSKNNVFTYFIYLFSGIIYGLIGFNYRVSQVYYNSFNLGIVILFILMKYSDFNIIQNNQFIIVLKVVYCIVSSLCFIISYNSYIKNEIQINKKIEA